MSHAGTQGFVSGAAQGAAAGSIAGVPGAVIGGFLGGIGGLISGNAAEASNKNAMAWAEYNRQSQYNISVYNAKSSLALAGFNAALARRAGAQNASNAIKVAAYNSEIQRQTMEYNEDLLDNELVRVWQGLDLDVTQIEMFRARERSNIVTAQASSGTVVGEGGNADVIISQQTQEAIDIEVVKFGADTQAANIANQVAQGRWQGEVAIQQIQWEGQMKAFESQYNAEVQARGSIASSIVQADAQMYSAKQAYMAGGNNISIANSQFNNQQTQSMVAGLYSAGGTASKVYYNNKNPSYTGSGSSLVT